MAGKAYAYKGQRTTVSVLGKEFTNNIVGFTVREDKEKMINYGSQYGAAEVTTGQPDQSGELQMRVQDYEELKRLGYVFALAAGLPDGGMSDLPPATIVNQRLDDAGGNPITNLYTGVGFSGPYETSAERGSNEIIVRVGFKYEKLIPQ